MYKKIYLILFILIIAVNFCSCSGNDNESHEPFKGYDLSDETLLEVDSLSSRSITCYQGTEYVIVLENNTYSMASPKITLYFNNNVYNMLFPGSGSLLYYGPMIIKDNELILISGEEYNSSYDDEYSAYFDIVDGNKLRFNKEKSSTDISEIMINDK